MTSAAAFVEGGIQDSCDDACSICLEAFCESNPSTVTSCKHDFHLQCILEWCHRSSNCPMCWQAISLKDPTSQELLAAVEQERSFRFTPRNAAIFRHPTLGDFELQHLPVGMNDPELEDRIIQHLAAAAAMGRTHHVTRREGSRSRLSGHGRPQFVVLSTHPNASSAGSISASPAAGEAEPEAAATTVTIPSPVQSNQLSPSSSGYFIMPTTRQGIANDNRNYGSQSSLPNQDRAGPSEFQSFSDTWKSRFNAMSMKYKESISKNTRGWKEKLFSRNTSMADIGSEVRREVNAGIATHEATKTIWVLKMKHCHMTIILPLLLQVQFQIKFCNNIKKCILPQHFIFEGCLFLFFKYDMLRMRDFTFYLEGRLETATIVTPISE
ncbi:E3 ubiquitin-protein ligase RHF2A [Abeliophyllum distichum]|uniref:RING-type E3 ubiquitin transferase n=1 Tax=Abeliophyllum distichum TaxID=126358 RepID=A0ABD1V8E5_9LAMI